MITGIYISQGLFSIDMLTALKLSLEHDRNMLYECYDYRRIHHVKFLAFHGNQLEHNGSQGANEAG